MSSTVYDSIETLIIASIMLGAGISFGSESDPYTFSNIPLQDSAPVLNGLVQKQINEVVNSVNDSDLTKTPDSAVVVLLMGGLYRGPTLKKIMNGTDSVHQIAIGRWEECVFRNNCEGWPKIERILLLPGESIYDEAKYNRIKL